MILGLGEKIEKVVNAALIIGFAVFSIGIIQWILTTAQSFNLPFESIIALLGLTIILLAVLAGKLFSRIE